MQRNPAGAIDGFRPDNLIVYAGGQLAYKTPNLLYAGGRRTIWLTPDDRGRQVLNLDIRDAHGLRAFTMAENQWEAVRHVDDLICPPSADGLTLQADSIGVSVKLKFEAIKLADVTAFLTMFFATHRRPEEALAAALDDIARSDGVDHYVVCWLEADLPEFNVRLTRTSTNFRHNVVFSGNSMFNCKYGIAI